MKKNLFNSLICYIKLSQTRLYNFKKQNLIYIKKTQILLPKTH